MADNSWNCIYSDFLFNVFQLVCEWRMTRGIQEQTKAFLDGFNEVVPLEWLQVTKQLTANITRKIIKAASKFLKSQ